MLGRGNGEQRAKYVMFGASFGEYVAWLGARNAQLYSSVTDTVGLSRHLSEGGVLSHHPALQDNFSDFLVQVIIIIALTRGLAIVGHALQQPKVIFEIVGGILLGPSAIGRDLDSVYVTRIFRVSNQPLLSVVANLGLVLYLFIVGMELDPKLLASHIKSAGSIAVCGMIVPFCLGVAISKTMIDYLQPNDNTDYTSFYIFIGTALSITAFPVLARILKEGGLIYTKVGALVMGAAAINDAVAWCLLTLAISIANAGDMKIAGYVFLSVLAFALGLLFLIRPIFEMIVTKVESLNSKAWSNHLFAFTIIFCFLCAWITALLGVHAIFGSFLFGLIVPRGSHLFRECNEAIEELVLTVMLPIYFTLSGLKTDITVIKTADQGAMIVFVCFIASISKYVGTGIPAYFSGFTLRESATVAALMNTRGLVELIVLNLGMESGILTIRTFSVMVIMCLFTTFITCPCVNFLYSANYRTKETDVVAARKGTLTKGSSIAVPTIESSIMSLNKEAKVGIVVDALEHLQGLMNLLVSLAPSSTETGMSVVAMKFKEPTYTMKDEFLGITDDGRLIQVEEELSEISASLMNDPTIKKPQMLPLSMLCKSLGVAVHPYNIQGNPEEFPVELARLGTYYNCNLVLVPWRPSVYLKQFFWSSLKTVDCNIAVVAQLNVTVSTAPEGRTRAGSIHNPRENRDRMGSNAGSDGGDSQTSDSVNQIPSFGTASTTQLYSNNPHAASARRKESITAVLPINTARRPISKILVVMTGQATDDAVIALALRYCAIPSMNITVLFPNDTISEKDVKYQNFKSILQSNTNVTVKTVATVANAALVLVEMSVVVYDLVITAFLEPAITHDTDVVTPRARSATLYAMTMTPNMPEIREINSAIGVVESLQDDPCPELGILGSKIYQSNVSASLLMVIHDVRSTWKGLTNDIDVENGIELTGLK